jgi:hypothetical protein
MPRWDNTEPLDDRIKQITIEEITMKIILTSAPKQLIKLAKYDLEVRKELVENNTLTKFEEWVQNSDWRK